MFVFEKEVLNQILFFQCSSTERIHQHHFSYLKTHPMEPRSGRCHVLFFHVCPLVFKHQPFNVFKSRLKNKKISWRLLPLVEYLHFFHCVSPHHYQHVTPSKQASLSANPSESATAKRRKKETNAAFVYIEPPMPTHCY